MKRITLRVSDEMHEKIRWLSYSQRRSQHEIVIEILDKALRKVEAQKEAKK